MTSLAFDGCFGVYRRRDLTIEWPRQNNLKGPNFRKGIRTPKNPKLRKDMGRIKPKCNKSTKPQNRTGGWQFVTCPETSQVDPSLHG